MVAPRKDDPTIPDSEDLYRRVLAICIVTEQASGRKRLSSQTFADPFEEISVDLSSLISPVACLALGEARHVGVIAVTAGEVRRLSQVVVRDPLPEDDAHALICGKQNRALRKRLARMARWICPLGANPLA